jgi:hypothetical protein
MYCRDGIFSDFIFSLITNTIFDDFKKYTQAFEIGAGMGRFSFALVNNFPKVHLIEPSESYSEVLKTLFNQEHVTIVNMTMEDFFKHNTIPENSIFFCFHLLHHLTSEQRKECFTFLRASGAPALFVEPNPWNPLIILQLLLYKDMRMKDEFQYLTFTKKKLSKEFNACGLSVAAYDRVCFLPPPITKIALKKSFLKKPLLYMDSCKHVLPFLSSYHVFYCKSKPVA